MIKITEVEGYRMYYDPSEKKFMLFDEHNESVASGDSQQELEKKAKVLRKQMFQRIPILKIGRDGTVIPGEITSVNRDDESMWVVLTHGRVRQERRKESLHFNNFCYENTEHNLAIAAKLRAQYEIIAAANLEITGLREQLEKPINFLYFGIER